MSRGGALPFRQAAIDAQLPRVVIGQRERHQAFLAQFPFAVGVQQLRRDPRRLQPLQHVGFLHAEARSDVGGGKPLPGQLGEGFTLVRRVHGVAHGVFRQAQLPRVRFRVDVAGHGVIVRQMAFRLERVQCGQPPASGEHVIFAFLRRVGAQILQQAMGEDGRFQLVARASASGAPDVERGFSKLLDFD